MIWHLQSATNSSGLVFVHSSYATSGSLNLRQTRKCKKPSPIALQPSRCCIRLLRKVIYPSFLPPPQPPLIGYPFAFQQTLTRSRLHTRPHQIARLPHQSHLLPHRLRQNQSNRPRRTHKLVPLLLQSDFRSRYLLAAWHHANLAARLCRKINPRNTPAAPAVLWFMKNIFGRMAKDAPELYLFYKDAQDVYEARNRQAG